MKSKELINKLSKVLNSEQLNKSDDIIRQLLELNEARENVLEIKITTPVSDHLIVKEELGAYQKALDAYSCFMEYYEEVLEIN